MKRWHNELPKYRQQWRKHGLTYRSDQFDGWLGERKSELGRYRKKHALDCGKASLRGLPLSTSSTRRPTSHEHEVRSDDSFREQLRELDREVIQGAASAAFLPKW
jgi:hypothetical protein